jgi:hypothetical protein
VPRKEGEASGAPVEEATGTEEAEVAEALLSEPPPPQGMKAAKWSGMLLDNRPPFIFLAAMRSSEPLSAGRKRMVAHFWLYFVFPIAGVHAFFIRNCCNTFGPPR